MTKRTKHICSLLAIGAFLAIAVASNTSKMTFKNHASWIPTDFDPNKTILLIQKIGGKQQQKMEDYMSTAYPYKYEFVDSHSILNPDGPYPDTKKYRFAILSGSQSSIMTTSTGGSMVINATDFYFYDRDALKSYPPTKRASSYAIMTFKPMINTIVKQFQ